MPHYQFYCDQCGREKVVVACMDDRPAEETPCTCGMQMRRVFGCHLQGLHKGPSNGHGGYHFNRPDPVREIKRAAQAMEAGGKMTPVIEKQIKAKLAHLEAHPPKPVDYEKDGHPCYD